MIFKLTHAQFQTIKKCLSEYKSIPLLHTSTLPLFSAGKYVCVCVSCDLVEVKTLLASVVTPLPITLSSLTACVYVCVHTAPGGAMIGADACSFTLGR